MEASRVPALIAAYSPVIPPMHQIVACLFTPEVTAQITEDEAIAAIPGITFEHQASTPGDDDILQVSSRPPVDISRLLR